MIRGSADAIEFYKKAFGATELMRQADADGRVLHAEIASGDFCEAVPAGRRKQAAACRDRPTGADYLTAAPRVAA
jgi:uncharacterized glyoxalase superfamily protein PhnB